MSRLYTRDAKAYPVTSQCELLGVSTQAYYKHGDCDMRKLAEEAFVVEFIKRVRQKDHGIGGGKLWKMYKHEFGDGHSVGYNRFYGIIKNELLMGMAFCSIEEVRRALKVAIDFYNNERPHMSLDWKTPAEAALCTGELEKKWVSYRENAIKALAAWILIRNFAASQEEYLATRAGPEQEAEESPLVLSPFFRSIIVNPDYD